MGGISSYMPVANLPVLSGPYKKIGVVQRYIVRRQQTSVAEKAVWPNQSEVVNDLTMKVFYPANTDATGIAGEYTTSENASALARFAKLPHWLFQHTTRARLNALENVSMASSSLSSVSSSVVPASSSSSSAEVSSISSKFPIILFSHGLGGNSDCYSITAEALASAGFIVFCPTHEDNSASLCTTANGEKKYYQFLTKEELNNNELAEKIRRNQLIRRVNEMKFLLNQIIENEKSNNWPLNPPWEGKLDLTKIIAFGHSFGGATSTYLATQDSRICCVVNHDGWMLPLPKEVKNEGISTPILMTVSQHFLDWKENWIEMEVMAQKNQKNNSISHLLLMEKTRHNNYSDVCLFSETLARIMKQIGKISMRDAFDIIHNVSIKFLLENIAKQNNEQNNDKENDINSQNYFTPSGTKLLCNH